MKYPFSPAVLDAMPEELAELFRELEVKLLKEITDRLLEAGKLNEVAVQDIRALRSHGIELEEIKKVISRTTGIGEQKLDRLFGDVVARNWQYYSGLGREAQIFAPETLLDDEVIDGLIRQTKGAYGNITRSMGFLVNNVPLPPAKAYEWALDQALLEVQSGGIAYNQAVGNATRKLADSGLQVVDYESGHHDQVDVAVRRAVMTGVNQVNARFAEQGMEFLETDYVEVSAHAGARDVDGPNGWENHKAWQGKVYWWKEKSKAGIQIGQQYPEFEETCGYGSVTGILGANCRHNFTPFVPGVMERTYTDEELANIDPLDFEYEGKKYTHYEATQKQREIERTVRKWKRREAAAATPEDRQACQIRIRRLQQKYREFSKAADLRMQPERMKVYVPGNTPPVQPVVPPVQPPVQVQPPPVQPLVQPAAQPPADTFSSKKLAAALGTEYDDFAAKVEASPAKPMYEKFSETPHYKQVKGGGCWVGNTIEWDYATHSGMDKYSTLAHESGHMFDKQIGKSRALNAVLGYTEFDGLKSALGSAMPMHHLASNCDEFMQALRRDMERINADLAKTCAEMKKTARNASAGVQDALDGFYGTQAKGLVPWGHGNRYYNRAFRRVDTAGKYADLKQAFKDLGFTADNADQVKALMRQYEAASEAWANVNSAVTCGGAEFDAIQKWMPDTLQAYLDIVGRMF